MSKVTVDNWFFSDKRFKSLVADERLIVLLVATNNKSTVGSISTKSGFVHEVVRVIIERLTKEGLITQSDEFFYMAQKISAVKSEVAVANTVDPDVDRVVQLLYAAINQTAPSGAKELKPKSGDYTEIERMVRIDKVPLQNIEGILQIYPHIPFWGEKFIVQSASGLRKHWLKIYQSAEKHYTKTRVEKI